MSSVIWILILLSSMVFLPAKSIATELDLESKVWVWHDALQIQLTDREADASMIVYMEYDAHKKNYITHFEQHFLVKKGRSVPASLLQFKELEVLRKVLGFLSIDKTESNIINSTIKPKVKPDDDGVFQRTYVFLSNIGDDSPFYGDPKTESYHNLKHQLKRILDRVLHHPQGVLVHSAAIRSCSDYLVPLN